MLLLLTEMVLLSRSVVCHKHEHLHALAFSESDTLVGVIPFG